MITISTWWSKFSLRLRKGGVALLSTALFLMPVCLMQVVITQDAYAFDTGSGANDQVLALAVQTDGKVLLGGAFTSVNGIPRNRIASLGTDGSVDGGLIPSDEEGDDFLLMVLPAIIAANNAITGTYSGSVNFKIFSVTGSVSWSDSFVITVDKDHTLVVNPDSLYPGSGTISGNSANILFPAEYFNLLPQLICTGTVNGLAILNGNTINGTLGPSALTCNVDDLSLIGTFTSTKNN